MELNLKPTFRFRNSQKAWEGLNEGFFNNFLFLKKQDQLKPVRNGSEFELHDVLIEVERAWVNPEVDFGNYFGYRQQKWTTLVNNYINKEELHGVLEEVNTRESKGSKNYNISMHFANNHGHGKGCLLTLTFSRVQGYKMPMLTATIRSSEITKRLLLDFLLIQRIGEMVYKKFSINLFISKVYMNGEAFTMYHNHKDLYLWDNMLTTEYQVKVRGLLHKFLTCDIKDIKYKVHKRCVRQLQRDENGHPLSGNRPMLAKELKLTL